MQLYTTIHMYVPRGLNPHASTMQVYIDSQVDTLQSIVLCRMLPYYPTMYSIPLDSSLPLYTHQVVIDTSTVQTSQYTTITTLLYNTRYTSVLGYVCIAWYHEAMYRMVETWRLLGSTRLPTLPGSNSTVATLLPYMVYCSLPLHIYIARYIGIEWQQLLDVYLVIVPGVQSGTRLHRYSYLVYQVV